MLDLNFVKSISERDIDMLLLEEFRVSPEFQEWFASRVFGHRVFKSIIGVWHSVDYKELGETDLLFIFESIEESRIALLIEIFSILVRLRLGNTSILPGILNPMIPRSVMKRYSLSFNQDSPETYGLHTELE